ncbi:MAG TPA: cation:proton antiporter [Vicinamibacterales bacterium]|nr:cation:proton antiporter [Vicinamibacterales bacterium]
MADLPLLVNLTVGLAYALVGGLIARRLGLPTIVGYLVAGVALSPVTPGFRGDPTAIHQLAEFGVILLMFGVGLHFSFRDLWLVRGIAIPGALAQMIAISVLGWLFAESWGYSNGGAWVFGVAISVASTVVLIRGFMDHGWLNSPAGKVAVGWLVFEDLATVAILVLLPVLTTTSETGVLSQALLAIGKAALFIALMIVVGTRVMPLLLGGIVQTRSRELFVLVALTVAAGTALASAALFGVSLALGAFVAGIVVNESPFSHQIGADLLPFREAFAVIFFVSVGMLVDPSAVAAHWGQLLVTVLLIMVAKPLVSAAIGFVLPYPAHTALVVAAGRGQIGEFSFILGQAGVALGLLTPEQYAIILAAAIISITFNPFVLRLVEPLERRLKRRPALWRAIDRHGADPPLPKETLVNHVVIVGCGRVGRHIAEALGRLGIPRLVVEVDPSRIEKLKELGVPVLYGDAGSSEILAHAALERARALVVTLPDDAAALAVVKTARSYAPELHVVARASTWEGGRRLAATGATSVVRPELEGGVEIVRRTLLELDLTVRDVQVYSELIRQEGLDESERPSGERTRVLHDLMNAARGLEVSWLTLGPDSPLAGQTIGSSRLRTRTGASIVAISRPGGLIANPEPGAKLAAGDRLALLGTTDQVTAAEHLIIDH